jgi:hypothetical protein
MTSSNVVVDNAINVSLWWPVMRRCNNGERNVTARGTANHPWAQRCCRAFVSSTIMLFVTLQSARARQRCYSRHYWTPVFGNGAAHDPAECSCSAAILFATLQSAHEFNIFSSSSFWALAPLVSLCTREKKWRAPKSRGETHLRVSQSQVAESWDLEACSWLPTLERGRVELGAPGLD